MKSTIFTLFTALILTHGVSVHAEGIFAKAMHSKLSKPANADIQFATLNADQNEGQTGAADQDDSKIQLASYCETSPCETGPCDTGCDSGCGSWFSANMAPGTGAFGGDSRFAAYLGFNQDTFFGNYTTAGAGYAINEKVDVTFYSLLWHTDFFSQNGLGGPSGLQGTGLWTEFGAGLNFKMMDGALNFNPSVGILNGALLSSGAGGVTPRVFDGFVPNYFLTYGDDFLESELYMGYYIGARGPEQNDYLHWWYNAGVKPWGDCNNWKSTLSTGLHYEMLRQTAPGDADNLYQWLGPYFQVALPNGFSMRYSAGWNLDDGVALGEDFYKVNIGYAF